MLSIGYSTLDASITHHHMMQHLGTHNTSAIHRHRLPRHKRVHPFFPSFRSFFACLSESVDGSQKTHLCCIICAPVWTHKYTFRNLYIYTNVGTQSVIYFVWISRGGFWNILFSSGFHFTCWCLLITMNSSCWVLCWTFYVLKQCI